MPSPPVLPDPVAEPRRRLLIGALLVALSALLFSTKAVVVKLAYPYGIDALGLLTLRMGFALPLFLVVAWSEERRAGGPLPGGDAARCAALGVVGYYLASFLDFAGLRFIGVGLERMVLYLYPALVVLGGAVFLGQRPTALVLGALGATSAGIVATFAGSGGGGPDALLGSALVAGSALAYACFVLLSGAMMRRIGGRRFMALAMSAACLAMLVHAAVALAVTGGGTLLAQPMPVYLCGLALALLGTVAPALLMGEGLARVGAQRFAIISTVGPIGTVVLGWLLLGEAVTPLSGAGILLTVAGGVAMGIGKAAAHAPAARQAERGCGLASKKRDAGGRGPG
jgi:drug/metabolite transporter (DMT)-like permease